MGHDSIACDPDAAERLANDGGNPYCKLVFILIYYFGMASSIW